LWRRGIRAAHQRDIGDKHRRRVDFAKDGRGQIRTARNALSIVI